MLKKDPMCHLIGMKGTRRNCTLQQDAQGSILITIKGRDSYEKKTNLFLENKSKCHNDKQNWRFWLRIDQKGHKIAIYVDHRTVGFYNNKKYIRKFACV